MNVSLTAELEEMVIAKVKSGLYTSASEVVREGLRLLRDHDELRRMRLADLQRDVDLGIEQVERGEFISSDSAEALSADIKRAGRRRITQVTKADE